MFRVTFRLGWAWGMLDADTETLYAGDDGDTARRIAYSHPCAGGCVVLWYDGHELFRRYNAA